MSTSQPWRVRYFDQLPLFESSLSVEAQSNIVQIAVYVKYLQKDKRIPIGTTKKYGQFTAVFIRGGLVFPGEKIVQGTPFSCLLFDFIKEKVFRISLSRIFNLISDFYEFEINHSQIKMLANTVLNSFCESSTVLHYGGKKQCKKWTDFPRKLFCVSDKNYFVCRKNCTNYQIYRGHFYSYSWAKEVKIA